MRDPRAPRWRRTGRRAAAVLLAAAVAGVALSCRRDPEAGRLRAWGSVEVRQVRIASRTAARVTRVLVDEGDRVRSGQPLVELDLAELDAGRQRASAAAEGATARERLLVAGARAEDVAAAEQALLAARVRFEWARRELERAEQLGRGDALPARDLESARTAVSLAEADAATRKVQLRKLVAGARIQELEAAAAARAEAEAAVAELDRRLADRLLVAPCDGVVQHRVAEPGEVARVGAPLLVLGEIARPYLDVYVPEPRLAEARVGAPVEVRADAHPGRTFEGIVTSVASEAEFTPKNVQTEDQRARLVFRVRVDVRAGAGELLAGMPAEARFPAAAPPTPPRATPVAERP